MKCILCGSLKFKVDMASRKLTCLECGSVYNLDDLKLDDSKPAESSWGIHQFQGVERLILITDADPSNFEFENGSLVKYHGFGTDIVVPEGVIAIGGENYYFSSSSDNGAFQNMKNIKSITLPKSCKEIRPYSFYGCSSLKHVYLPDGLEYIGDNAFERCEKLESIVIPKSVKKIGAEAFERCKKLESITIPGSVKSIGERAFNGCENLKQVQLQSGIETIGKYVFDGCSELYSLELPDGIQLPFKENKSSYSYYSIADNINMEIIYPDDLKLEGKFGKKTISGNPFYRSLFAHPKSMSKEDVYKNIRMIMEERKLELSREKKHKKDMKKRQDAENAIRMGICPECKVRLKGLLEKRCPACGTRY